MTRSVRIGDPTPRLSGALDSIQALRFFAAFAVVIYHAHGNLFGFDARGAPANVFGLGQAGVHVFFVISGFIMVYTVAGRPKEEYSVVEFSKRRFVRVYPVYWLCVIFYVFFHYYTDTAYGITGLQTVASLLLLPGYSSAIIGPGWTLSYEIYFYACFGIFMSLGFSRGLVAMTAFFLISIAFGAVTGIDVPPVMQLATNALLLEFLLGSWIAFFLLKIMMPSRIAGALMIAASVIGFGASAVIGYENYPLILMWGPSSALLVMGAATLDARRALPRPVRSMAFLGSSSYLLYLSHILVIDALAAVGLRRSGIAFVDLGVLPAGVAVVCCAVAAGLHPVVERPLLARISAMLARSRTAREGADGRDPRKTDSPVP